MYALPANISPLSDNRTDPALVIRPAFPFARASGFHWLQLMPQLIVTREAAELGLVATYHVVEDLRNRQRDPDFDEFKDALCARLSSLYSQEFVARDKIVQGFRDLHWSVGCSPKKFPCSIEGLIKFLRRHGTLPNINLAVDCYNAVSLETRLTLGAHDLDQVEGNIILQLAQGNEHFVPLGRDQHEPVQAGEYCYVDESGEILCRLDYKQCDKSKIKLTTTRCLIIVQGHASTASDLLDYGRDKLVALVNRFCRAI